MNHFGRTTLVVSLALAPAAFAQPRIAHVGLECVAPGRFAVVLSGIDPEADIQTAKVYFRSQLYPDFYYVAMKHEGDRFIGVLPQVTPETPRVIYYLEAVDRSFESVRSQEFDPVVGKCDDDRGARTSRARARRSWSERRSQGRPPSRLASPPQVSWEPSPRRERPPASPRE